MVEAEIMRHCPFIVKIGGRYIFLDIYLGVAWLDYIKVKHVWISLVAMVPIISIFSQLSNTDLL